MWNERFRLSPKFSAYHKDNHAFRPAPKDIQLIQYLQKQDVFNDKARALSQNKKDTQSRYAARRLERSLIQYKSN